MRTGLDYSSKPLKNLGNVQVCTDQVKWLSKGLLACPQKSDKELEGPVSHHGRKCCQTNLTSYPGKIASTVYGGNTLKFL